MPPDRVESGESPRPTTLWMEPPVEEDQPWVDVLRAAVEGLEKQ
jgi:hypothetical protein